MLAIFLIFQKLKDLESDEIYFRFYLFSLLFVGSLLPNVERKTWTLLKIACNGQLLVFICYLQA